MSVLCNGKTRKPIPKFSRNKATTKGERICLDITSVKGFSFGGSKYWLMLQDEYTDFIWSIFIKSKDLLPTSVIKLLTDIQKDCEIEIKYIRCDNSG